MAGKVRVHRALWAALAAAAAIAAPASREAFDPCDRASVVDEIGCRFPAVSDKFSGRIAPETATVHVDGQPVPGFRLGTARIAPPRSASAAEREAWIARAERKSDSPFSAFFPATYRDPFVFEAASVRVVLHAVDASPVPAAVGSGRVVYRDAYPETDVLHAVGPDRSEEFLLLRSPDAPLQFVYRFEAEGVRDVELVGEEIRFTDSDGNGLIIERPWLIDAEGSRSVSAVRWELERDRLRLVIDPEGLAYPLLVDPTWIPTGDLNVATTGHTATLLDDGTVLVVGGFDGVSYVGVAELYDPATGTWTFPTNFPIFGRTEHTATKTADGRVFVIGGFTGSGYTNSIEVYDPPSETWSQFFLNSARGSHSATLQPDGNIFVVGGFDGAAYVASSEVVDTTFSLSSFAPAPFYGARARHSATVLADGRLLVAGGENGGGLMNTSEIWDFVLTLWTPTAGTMTVARKVHTATRLGDDRVLVAGGSDGAAPLSGAELYDPGTDTWSVTSPLSVPREGHTATTLSNGQVMAVAGQNGLDYLASVEFFDPTTDTWSDGKAANANRTDHTATALNDGTVLVTGGVNETGSGLRSSEIYEPIDSSEGEWSNVTAMANTRLFHTATLMQDGSVLVVAGGPGGQTSTETYDPATGDWTSAGNITGGRSRHTATLLQDGNVLVVGGQLTGSPLDSCQVFDPVARTWTPTGSLGTARRLHTATLLEDGRVLVVGGIGPSGTTADAELYDPASGTWSPTASMGLARDSHAAALLSDGKVLVAGGFDGVSALASAEVFDPVGETWSTPTFMAEARNGPSATRLPDGRVLVAGGTGGVTSDTTSEIFDPAGPSWSPTATGLGSPRSAHTASLLPNGIVMVAGGPSAGTAVELFAPATETWRPATPINNARRDHTATVLPDGDVLVTGGSDAGPIASAELYRSTTDAWSPAGTLTRPRVASTMTPLPDGRVLMAGGTDGTPTPTAEIFNPGTGTWSATGSSSTAHYGHRAHLLMDGTVLVVGGFGSGSVESEIFDPGLGTWRRVGDLNVGRFFFTSVLLGNGKVLAIGGLGESSAEIYDPQTESWTLTASLPAITREASATVLPDGRVLVAGGSDGSTFVSTAHLFDPVTETWSPTGNLNRARSRHSATLLPNGKVLVASGTTFTSQTEIYDPATGVWSVAGSLNAPKSSKQAMVLLPSGKVLMIGGAAVNEGSVFVEIFDPATNSWTATDSLGIARAEHNVSLLPDGRVLAAGGEFWTGSQWIILDSTEVYDAGGGFVSGWQPTLTSVTDPIVDGGPVTAVGTQFQGVSEATGGNGARSSSTSYPLLQIRRIDNGASFFVPVESSLGWTGSSFESIAVTGVPAGPALATVFTNGIPSDSRFVTLECAPPSITTSPTPQVTCMGGTVVFNVVASGECLGYQWRLDGAPLADGGHYSGTQTSSLTVSNVDFNDVGTYDVEVTSTCSSTTVLSAPATLTLNQPPPTFAGVSSVTAQTSPCQMQVDWGAAVSGCPTTPGIAYNVYRSETPAFTPGPANLIASCVAGLSYNDTAGLTLATTYHYIVRAEDSSTGFGGPCNGGREDFNIVERFDTAACSTTSVPAAVPFFTVTSTDGQNLLEWQNPGTGAYSSTKTLYRTDMFPTGPNDPSAFVVDDRAGTQGAHDAVPHASLSNGTTYYYAAYVDGGASFSGGRFATGTPFSTSGPVKWSYTTGASALAPPGIGNAAHAVSNDRVLHAMVRGSGGGAWPAGWIPYAMSAPAQARPPAVPITLGAASRVVFLGSQDGYVYAVDANTGAQLWQSAIMLGDMVQAAPAGIFQDLGGTPFDHVLVGSRNSSTDNVFYALNVADGTVAWTFDNGGGSSAIGIISGGATVDYSTKRVYFASRAKVPGTLDTVFAVELTAGGFNPVWARGIGNVDGSPVRANGRVYVGNNASQVHAFDPATGADLWSAPYNLADGPVKGFVFPEFGTSNLYVSTTGRIWSLSDDGASVSKNWDIPILSPSIPLLTHGATRYLLVGSGDGKLYQVEIATQTVTSVTIGDGSAVVGAPSLDVANNMVYVGAGGGIVYAVQLPIP